MTAPDALVGLQPGDALAIDANNSMGMAPSAILRVERLTPTHAVTTQGRRFRLDTGREVGALGYRSRATRATQDQIMAEARRLNLAHARARFYTLASGMPFHRMGQADVTTLRQACDRLEQAMRGAGEWKEDSQA